MMTIISVTVSRMHPSRNCMFEILGSKHAINDFMKRVYSDQRPLWKGRTDMVSICSLNF